MTTPDNIYIMLGRWKHIIVFDLYTAFYQNHMDKESQPWLGIMTPFSGLRALTRSGQGLLRQSKELDKLLSKIFKEEMQAGIIAKIQDDIVIGGETQAAAAHNYINILHKLHLANLKI